MRGIAEFVRDLVGDVVEPSVVNELASIGTNVGAVLIYGAVTLVTKGYGKRLAMTLALVHTFKRGFLRLLFNTLMASSSPSDDVVDGAGIVSTAYLLSALAGQGEEERPPFLGSTEVPPEVYASALSMAEEGIEDYGARHGVSLGQLGRVYAIVVATAIVVVVVGLCQGVLAEGYPEGVRRFLEFALEPAAQFAISELLSPAG